MMQIEGDDRHHCYICNRCLDQNEQEIVDSLVELESSTSCENMLALAIGEHSRLYANESCSDIVGDSYFYCDKYVDFLLTFSKGGLTYPSDHTVQ